MTAPIRLAGFERQVTPRNCARLFRLYGVDTAQIARLLFIPEHQAYRLLHVGLADPANERFKR